jgi:hypothetical protein
MKKILKTSSVLLILLISCTKEEQQVIVKKDCECGEIISKKIYNGNILEYTTKNYCTGNLLHLTTSDSNRYNNVFVIGAEYCFWKTW